MPHATRARIFVPLAVLLIIAVSSPQISRGAILLSGPIEGNSWTINFSQSPLETWRIPGEAARPVGYYDYFRVDWVSGSLLETPGLRNLTGGWSTPAEEQTSTFSWATGPPVEFDFSVTLEDPIEATVFRTFVYYGNTLKQAQEWGWDSNGHHTYTIHLGPDQGPGRYPYIDEEPPPEPPDEDPPEGPSEVPEPSSLAVLSVAFLALGCRALRGRRTGAHNLSPLNR